MSLAHYMYTTLTVAYALKCWTLLLYLHLTHLTRNYHINLLILTTLAPACMLLSIKDLIPNIEEMWPGQSIWRKNDYILSFFLFFSLTSWQPCFLFCFSFLLYFNLSFPSFISWRHLTVWKYTIPLIHLYYTQYFTHLFSNNLIYNFS